MAVLVVEVMEILVEVQTTSYTQVLGKNTRMSKPLVRWALPLSMQSAYQARSFTLRVASVLMTVTMCRLSTFSIGTKLSVIVVVHDGESYPFLK